MSKRKKKKPASSKAVQGESAAPLESVPEAGAASESAASESVAPEGAAAESASPAAMDAEGSDSLGEHEAPGAHEEPEQANGGRDPRDDLPTHASDESSLDLEALAGEGAFDPELTINLVGDPQPLPGRDDLDEPTVTVTGEAMVGLDHVMLQRKHLRGLLEALVFASDSPITPKALAKLASAQQKQVKDLLAELKQDYATRGMHLDEVAGGWVFRTSPQYAPFVRDLTKQKPVRLTRAQVETLAIIAYRQPITRPEVDDVRGVDSGPVLKLLLERDLVRILGKRDEPGRPLIYGTTGHFLEFFGLKSLKDLPTLREFTELSDESREAFEDELAETPEEAAARQAAEAAATAGGEGAPGESDASANDDASADAAPTSSRVPVDEHSGDLEEALGELVGDELGDDDAEPGELEENEGVFEDATDVDEVSAEATDAPSDDHDDNDDDALDAEPAEDA